jgi:hypothetical protein
MVPLASEYRDVCWEIKEVDGALQLQILQWEAGAGRWVRVPLDLGEVRYSVAWAESAVGMALDMRVIDSGARDLSVAVVADPLDVAP